MQVDINTLIQAESELKQAQENYNKVRAGFIETHGLNGVVQDTEHVVTISTGPRTTVKYSAVVQKYLKDVDLSPWTSSKDVTTITIRAL